MATGDHFDSGPVVPSGPTLGDENPGPLVAEESGAIRGRACRPTPRDVGPEQVLAAIERLVEQVLDQQKLDASKLAGWGWPCRASSIRSWAASW